MVEREPEAHANTIPENPRILSMGTMACDRSKAPLANDYHCRSKGGHPKGLKNSAEQVIVRSSRCRQIKPTAKVICLQAGLAKQATLNKEQAHRAELRRRKEAWLW